MGNLRNERDILRPGNPGIDTYTDDAVRAIFEQRYGRTVAQNLGKNNGEQARDSYVAGMAAAARARREGRG
ncbi:hypothetical protein [Aeromonas dhakensis]|uniref:hypothetical protein n=1 Tax=Aeromonas dhakensis TaxID=196024 RepID=UPI0005A66EC7|nr:hypothetical protein [Aeromonas dhakensis]